MSDNIQLHPSVRALMLERFKRADRFENNGVEYSALLKYRCTADEDKAIDDLIIEAARCRVNYCLREGVDRLSKFEVAARASRIHMLRLIMSNYDECGDEGTWEQDPHALASLIREFQLNIAHAIIGTPEVVYRFGDTEEGYRTPLSTDVDKRLGEYARKHGWLAIIVDGGELGNADYTVRDAAMLGVTENSDDEEIRALYDSFISRLYAYIAIDNFLDYRERAEDMLFDHIKPKTEGDLIHGYTYEDDITFILDAECGRQILDTCAGEITTHTVSTEGLGKVLSKATDFYAMAACDAAQGYTALGREAYTSMIDELLNDLLEAEQPELAS